MAKNNYWKKRFEILEDNMNNKATPEVLKVQQKLKQANKEIDMEILKWYQRFADNNQISMKDAKKMLSAKQLAEFKWDVNEYIKYGQDNEMFNGLWMKELENASARFHISRLEALKIHTQQSIEKAFADYNSTATNLFGDVYQSDYYMTAFEVQKGFNIGFDVGAINNKQLEMVLSKPWTTDKKTFSKRIWDSRAKLVTDVHTHLTRNVLLGKPPDDAINAIAKSFNTTKNQAGRLIMTESAYFASVAQKDCFNMLDVEQFEIVATLDSHTSEICQELDGKVFDMKDYEAGVTAPPFHVWCRTTTVPFFDDNYTERVARGTDGKTYYVPGGIDYHKWFDLYVTKATEQKFQTLIGSTTSNGIIVNSYSRHSLERAIERNISNIDIADALQNPIKIGKIKARENGKSQEFLGQKARVQINPDTGNIITIWAMSSKKIKKIKGGGK